MKRLIWFFCLLPAFLYSQNNLTLKAAGSILDYEPFKYGGAIKIAYSFNERWLVQPGIEINQYRYIEKGDFSAISSNTIYGYHGPHDVKGNVFYYQFPIEFEYLFRPKSQFSLAPQLGYLGMLSYDYYIGNPDFKGNYGKESVYKGYRNCITFGLSLKYKLGKRIGIFNDTKIIAQLFYDEYHSRNDYDSYSILGIEDLIGISYKLD